MQKLNSNLNLKNLSNSDLDIKLKSLVVKEREVLSDIITYIVEVDSRRLYLAYGFPNLFAYLTLHVGYSNGSAQRRIAAARLSREVPEVVAQIEQGNLNLSQISLIHQSIKQAEMQATALNSAIKTDTAAHFDQLPERKITTEVKKVLVAEVTNKSMQESEVAVKKILNIAPKEATKATHQKDKSVRFEVTLSEEQWQKMNQIRDLLSHSNPDGSWDRVLEYACDQIIKRKDKSQKSQNVQPEEARPEVRPEAKANAPAPVAAAVGVAPAVRGAIPVAVQRAVFQRGNRCCQYVDKKSGRRCTSTWQLSLDHIQPVWAGGSNAVENLRVLCASHNRELYRQQVGIKFI